MFTMIGELAVSFCDRKIGQGSVCLDLWSYPDGTYNLVIENFVGPAKNELSFPCAFHQLAGLLDSRALVTQNDAGVLAIEQCGGTVCAEFVPFEGHGGFRHCVGAEEYRMAIAALESDSVGYLA